MNSDIGRYAIVPEWLLDKGVSGNAIRVFAALAAKYADRDENKAKPTRDRLAKDLNVSERTVDAGLKELVEAKALVVTPRYNVRGVQVANEYELHYGRQGEESCEVGRNSLRATSQTVATLQEDPESRSPESVASQPLSEPRAKRTTVVDEPFIEAMVARFEADLGGPDGVRDRIAAALGHKQRLRYTDLQAYVRNWLRNDLKREQERRAERTQRPRGNLRPVPVRGSLAHPDDRRDVDTLWERQFEAAEVGM